MRKSEELWDRVTKTTNAERKLVVAYLKRVAAEAKQLPALEREARGDYSSSLNKFPQTKGERISNNINYALMTQDWIDHDTADDLVEISEIAGNLEINTNDHDLWAELFEKIEKLPTAKN